MVGRRIFPGIIAALCGHAASADIVQSTWTGGGGSTLWTNPANWSPAIIPQNTPLTQFEVTIPPDTSVSFGSASLWEINALSLGQAAALDVTGPLRVLGATTINGDLSALLSSANFIADPPLAAVTAPRGTLRAASNGTLTFGATSYSSLGSAGGGTGLFTAEGTGSRLLFPNLTLLDGRFDDGNTSQYTTQVVRASQNGRIECGALTEIRGSLKRDDRLIFLTSTGGQLLFPSFTTLTSGFTDWQLATNVLLPAAQSIANARFYLSGGATLTSPILTTLDHCGFNLSEGARFTSAATTLNVGQIRAGPGESNALFLTANGTGTLLDLSSIQTIDASADGGIPGPATLDIHAYNSATIKLPNLHTIIGPSNSTRIISVFFDPTGTLTLPALQSTSGRVAFHINQGGANSLPVLQSALGAQFYIEQNTTLITPLLTAIDDSTFSVDSHSTLTTVATVYRARNILSNASLFGGSFQSTLNLTSITTLDDSFDDGSPSQTIHGIGTSAGSVDLSGLQSILGPVRQEDRLRFAATNGPIRFSSLTLPASCELYLTTAGIFNITGDLTVTPAASFNGDSGASPATTSIRIGGNFQFQPASPSAFAAARSASIAMVGFGEHTFEVCSANIGNIAPSSSAPNFAIGLLQVGDFAVNATVHLVDQIDNSPGPAREALYLHSSSGPVTGLRILGGSTLDLGNLPAYAKINNVMTNLRSLFPPGITRIPFDQGWLTIACVANCDGSTTPPILTVNDFMCFLNRFSAGDLEADCDLSTAPPILNVNDFNCFLNKFAIGCQ